MILFNFRTLQWLHLLPQRPIAAAVRFTWRHSSNHNKHKINKRRKLLSQETRKSRALQRLRQIMCRETRCLGIHFNRAHRVYTALTDTQATWKWASNNKLKTSGSKFLMLISNTYGLKLLPTLKCKQLIMA